MSLPPYQYEPLQGLDAVRVLVLKPSPDFAAELECDVIQYSRLASLCSLDTTTQYSAVSYAWGEPVCTHHIRCASTATPSRISITANADGMLRHLRHLADARYLWIDAICLNQADEAEKAAQIPLMDQIYQQARAVHVWLGPDQGDAKAVFALIRSLATVPDDPTDEADHVAGLIERVLGKAANRVLCAFWGLPWFTRRWVLQEVLLAQQVVVHYGREQLPWLGLTLATKRLGAASTDGIVNIPMHPSVNALGALSKFRQGSNHLLELIWEFHDWQCSDPKDRIFALHGLCHKGRTGTLPAYTLSWVDVYTRFAQACINQGYQSAILMHLAAFGSLNHRDDRLPSWVPDWSLARKNFRLPGRTEIPKTKLEEYGKRRRSLIPQNERSPTKSGECVFGVRHRGSVIKVMQQGTSWQHTRRLFYLFSAANSWANSGSIEQLLQYTALGSDHTDGAWTRALGRFHTIVKQNSVQPLPLALPEEEDVFRLVHEILSEYSLTITDRGVFGYVSPIFHGWSGLDIYDLVPLTGPREKQTSMDWRVALVAFQPSLKHEAFDSTVHQDSDQIYWDRKIHGICLHGTETTFATGTKELIVS